MNGKTMINTTKTLLKWLSRTAGNTLLNQRRLQTQLAQFDRLNIGCGEYPGSGVDDWLNIGLFSLRRVPYGVVRHENGRALLHFDMTRAIPMPDDSVQYVYSSHFIEHLSLDQGIAFLQECHRVMCSGAHIRITCPDLEIWICRYMENEMAFFERFYGIFQSYPNLHTKGQILMGQVQGWGHKWLYDFESLRDLMTRAGFVSVNKCHLHESALPDIGQLEPDDEGRVMETLFVEARKP
jgi:predicted SAM-dependent methyltransferase